MGRTVSPSSVLNRLLTANHKLSPHTTRLLSSVNPNATTMPSTHPFPPPFTNYITLLQSITSLPQVYTLFSDFLTHHPSPPTFLLNQFIQSFAKFDSITHICAFFQQIPYKNNDIWNTLIKVYSQLGDPRNAMLTFATMNSIGIPKNHVTFSCMLGCCAHACAFSLIEPVHGLTIKAGVWRDAIVGCALVDCYGKCWRLDEAQKAFKDVIRPNAVCWNVIVRHYLEAGKSEEAVVMFFDTIRSGVQPLNYGVSNALKASVDVLGLVEGKVIHGIVVKIGMEKDNVVVNALLEMYGKCGLVDVARLCFDQHCSKDVISWTSMVSLYVINGRVDSAEEIFNNMPIRNVVSWNAMLAGYVQSSRWENALDRFRYMCRGAEQADHVTIILILNACSRLFDLEKGKEVHGFAYRHGLIFVGSVGNALLDVYGRCGNLRYIELCFLQLGSHRDRVSWNSLIRSFTIHRRSELALIAFREMQREVKPDEYTFNMGLAACANVFALDLGRQIHGCTITSGCHQNAILSATLIDMYSKCRSLEYAAKVFERETSQDVIMWNSMIIGCAYNGYGRDALDLFEEMERANVRVDNATLFGVLLACVSNGLVDVGKKYFILMSEKYGVIPLVEHYDCMIDLFGGNGRVDELKDFISSMPFNPTVAMWKKVLNYCNEHGNTDLAEEATRKINEAI